MPNILEAGKEYKTKRGKRARIYAVDGVGETCAHGAILEEDGWEETTWTIGGIFWPGHTMSQDINFSATTEPSTACVEPSSTPRTGEGE
jgi:hypothetical protein